MCGTRCTNGRKKIIQGFGWKARKEESAANKMGGRYQNGFQKEEVRCGMVRTGCAPENEYVPEENSLLPI